MTSARTVSAQIRSRDACRSGGVSGKVGSISADAALFQNLAEGVGIVFVRVLHRTLHVILDHVIGVSPRLLPQAHLFERPLHFTFRHGSRDYPDQISGSEFRGVQCQFARFGMTCVIGVTLRGCDRQILVVLVQSHRFFEDQCTSQRQIRIFPLSSRIRFRQRSPLLQRRLRFVVGQSHREQPGL